MKAGIASSLSGLASDGGSCSQNSQSSSDFDEELLDPALKLPTLSSATRNRKRSWSNSSIDQDTTSNPIFNNGRTFNSESGNAAVKKPLQQYITSKTRDDMSKYRLS